MRLPNFETGAVDGPATAFSWPIAEHAALPVDLEPGFATPAVFLGFFVAGAAASPLGALAAGRLFFPLGAAWTLVSAEGLHVGGRSWSLRCS
jgi:hypothetical protein